MDKLRIEYLLNCVMDISAEAVVSLHSDESQTAIKQLAEMQGLLETFMKENSLEIITEENPQYQDYFTRGGQSTKISPETVEDLRKNEFVRRLNQAGYRLDNAEVEHAGGAGNFYVHDRVFKDGKEMLFVNKEGDMLYCPENRKEAYEIFDIRNDVNEYISAYLKAANAGAEQNQGYHFVNDWNGYVLGAKQMQNDGFQFVVWNRDMDGKGFSRGHYFTDFENSKEDFALRSGLVNSDKMFTETELKVIRSSLSDFFSLDSGTNLNYETEKAVKDIIRKIDNVVVPEIIEEQEQHEENGDDIEREL